MASLSQLITHKPSFPTKRTNSPATPACPLHHAQARFSLSTRNQRHALSISCSAKNENKPNDNDPALNRRDMLIGLGGLYSASTAVTTQNIAKAVPVVTPQPDASTCGKPTDLPKGAVPLKCCPPVSAKAAKIFTPLGLDTPLKVRPAAHLVNQDYIEKFSEALRLMKELPDSDPISFRQQHKVHCAYCDFSYHQVGFDKGLQVHGGWLFFPFHRAYLYFFERILGKMINEPNFAMPFWNWDSAAGMKVPTMYTDPRYEMFNVFRDPGHMPKLVDLDFKAPVKDADGKVTEQGVAHDIPDEKEMIDHNYYNMYRAMISNGDTPQTFFGKPYRGGMDKEPGGGSIESGPHNSVHDWVGHPSMTGRENMGSLYSAGRDPLFYAHHSNVDRMWNIWKTLDSISNVDIGEPDYLNASFMLYDENRELVQIKVSDCLNTEKQMRYTYEQPDVKIEWLNHKPLNRVAVKSATRSLVPRPNLKTAQFPLVLDEPVRVTVRRPKTNRSDVAKKLAHEMLLVSGIKHDGDVRAKFDVFVNAHNHKILGPADRQYLGSYSSVPRKHKHDNMGMGIETSIQFGLNEVIDDLGANGDETIEVTIAPRHDKGQIIISGVSVEYSS